MATSNTASAKQQLKIHKIISAASDEKLMQDAPSRLSLRDYQQI